MLTDAQIVNVWVILGKRIEEVSEYDIYRAKIVAAEYQCAGVPELVRVLNKIVLENGDEGDIVRDSNKITKWDCFAAAALAGFGIGVPIEKTVRQCCETADLMMIESQRRSRDS